MKAREAGKKNKKRKKRRRKESNKEGDEVTSNSSEDDVVEAAASDLLDSVDAWQVDGRPVQRLVCFEAAFAVSLLPSLLLSPMMLVRVMLMTLAVVMVMLVMTVMSAILLMTFVLMMMMMATATLALAGKLRLMCCWMHVRLRITWLLEQRLRRRRRLDDRLRGGSLELRLRRELTSAVMTAMIGSLVTACASAATQGDRSCFARRSRGEGEAGVTESRRVTGARASCAARRREGSRGREEVPADSRLSSS